MLTVLHPVQYDVYKTSIDQAIILGFVSLKVRRTGGGVLCTCCQVVILGDQATKNEMESVQRVYG
jgi:hypothetical protein